jgi:hypothetical protein
MALLCRGFPLDEIMSLEVGDFFDARKVISLLLNSNYLKIVTEDNVVYTAHFKPEGCTIHKRIESTKFERRHERKRCEAKQKKNKEK